MKVPPRLAEAARARVQQTRVQRLAALAAINNGRPLEAEPDTARRIRRLQSVMQVGPRQAEAMVSAPAAQLLPAKRNLQGREIVHGGTVDFLNVAFLETAVAAAGTVARVAYADRRPQGSGFMVSDRLFLTNNHVIPAAPAASQFVLEFDYQLDYRGQQREPTRFGLAPEVFFLTSPETELDFTLIAVGRRLEGKGELGAYGYTPLLARDDKHVLGELVNVVQHPEGNFKQAVIRENQLVARLNTVLHYVADTMPGSSGSPVFNDQWEVVALHHWGEPFTETIETGGKPVRHDVNEGIRVSAILRQLTDLRTSAGGESQRSLLDAVLEPKVQYPSPLLRLIDRGAPSGPPDGSGGPSLGPAEVREDGSATWTVPLQISVHVGRLKTPAPSAPETLPFRTPLLDEKAAGEKIEIDRQYSNRQGYNPKFLKSFPLPLPKLSKTQREAAAKVKNLKSGEDPLELKYTHFSIKMNASRRMAYFTACNIDGRTWVHIERKTDLPSEAAEATETWYDDPRIDPDAQCEQSLYDAQQPKRIFDRGHLVRRQDPTWGPGKRAIRANADTFHFANCAPQASTFNRSAKFWQGIEQYILEDNAVADDDRITVFTGPVFGENDREYRYVAVPAKFFKVIARVQDGELLATALLADQSQFLEKLPESLTAEAMEAWDETTKVDEFLSSVIEIEELTGLDFGVLRDHDTHSGGETIRAPLTDFSDVPLYRPSRRARSRPEALSEFAPTPGLIPRVGASRKRR